MGNYYIGKVPIDDGHDELKHYGRKGMKWGKDIFGDNPYMANSRSTRMATIRNTTAALMKGQRTASRPGATQRATMSTDPRSRQSAERIAGSVREKIAPTVTKAVNTSRINNVRNKGRSLANERAQKRAVSGIVDVYRRDVDINSKKNNDKISNMNKKEAESYAKKYRLEADKGSEKTRSHLISAQINSGAFTNRNPKDVSDVGKRLTGRALGDAAGSALQNVADKARSKMAEKRAYDLSFQKKVDNAKKAVSKAGDTIADTANKAGKAVKDTAEKVGNAAKDTAEKAGNAAKKAGSAISDWGKSSIDKGKSTFDKVLNRRKKKGAGLDHHEGHEPTERTRHVRRY